jgi:hypothetical protein
MNSAWIKFSFLKLDLFTVRDNGIRMYLWTCGVALGAVMWRFKVQNPPASVKHVGIQVFNLVLKSDKSITSFQLI